MVADAQFDLFRIRAIKISILERGFDHFLNDATTKAPLPENDASRTLEKFRRALAISIAVSNAPFRAANSRFVPYMRTPDRCAVVD
jgi:hypothetical protein